MAGMRKSYPDELKARVALEALKEQKTLEEISSVFQVPSAQITRWKKQLKDNLAKVFNKGKTQEVKDQEILIERLYRELGKLQVEYEWLEQFSYNQRLELVDTKDSTLSVRKQCEILQVNRSTLYYQAKEENPYDIELKDAIRLLYGKYPFYGHRKVTSILKRMGWKANRKKVRRLRRELGLDTLYPKPNLSKSRREHKKYPYLLKGLEITRVNQVWSTDITFVRVKGKGWIYVVAILDWFSRYIISFEVSISQEVDFCLSTLMTALQIGAPDIFNSDQGSQFTSKEFIDILERKQIKISMDSVGRALDNVRTERYWRSLKYEEVFLKEYESVTEARKAIKAYIQFYNNERIHQSLNYYTPAEIYFGKENLDVKKW